MSGVDKIYFPGLEANDRRVSIGTGNIVVLYATYQSHLEEDKLQGDKPVKHTIKFHLVAQNDLECLISSIFIAFRVQTFEVIRVLQHTRVQWKSCAVEIYESSQKINQNNPIPAKTLSSRPIQQVQTPFNGRGSINLNQENLTLSQKRVLSTALNLRLAFLVPAGLSPNELNRWSLLGHRFFNQSSLRASLNGPDEKTDNFVDGAPIASIQKLCSLFENGLVVNGILFKFYDVFRGGEFYLPVMAPTLGGLTYTSKTKRLKQLEDALLKES